MGKVVFDHLPKCGGTSVRRFLMACVGEQRVAPPLQNISVGRALRLFEHYDVITGHFEGQVLVGAFPGVRYITLLRHPVDRIVSAYHFLQMPHFDGLRSASALAARSMSLREFVSEESGAAADANRNNMTRHFASVRGFSISPSDALAAALANIMRYDVVGLLDDLPRFFDDVTKRFGWSTPEGEFHERKNADRPSLDEVDPEIRAIIESNNELDIALYDAVRKHLNGDAVLPPAASGDAGDRDSQYAEACSLRLLSLNGGQKTNIRIASGEPAIICAEVGIPADLPAELYAIIVFRDAAEEAVYWTSCRLEVQPSSAGAAMTLRLEISLKMQLGEGRYAADFCVWSGRHSTRTVGVLCRSWLRFVVAGHSKGWFAGISDLEAQWDFRRIE